MARQGKITLALDFFLQTVMTVMVYEKILAWNIEAKCLKNYAAQERFVPCVDEEYPAGCMTAFCRERRTVIFKSLEALGGKTFLQALTSPREACIAS